MKKLWLTLLGAILATALSASLAFAAAPVLTAESKTLHWTDVPAATTRWRIEIFYEIEKTGPAGPYWTNTLAQSPSGSTQSFTPEVTPTEATGDVTATYKVREKEPVEATEWSNAATIHYPHSVPSNTGLPAISGSTVKGQTLTTTTGTWSHFPTSYSYQWEDCNTSGSGCSTKTGATASTYKLAAGDVGYTIRAVVTATNVRGSGSATSNATAVVTAESTGSITDRLTSDKTAVEVMSLPPGTGEIGVAIMKNLAGEGVSYLHIPATQTTYTPPSGDPVVDIQANTASGEPIGGWAGRLQTVPMWVGLNAGGGGSPQYADVAGAVSYVRLDSGIEKGCSTEGWSGVGLKVDCDIVGPYTQGGIKTLNRAAWVANAVAIVRANPTILSVEVLNEPDGSWFWGNESESSENIMAYANLVKETHEAFAKEFGSAAPNVLATYDGQDNSLAFGEKWWAVYGGQYADGLVLHPYPIEHEGRPVAALGQRSKVEQAHAKTGKPIYVTEVGWRSSGGSPAPEISWTEAEQAANIKNFITWAHGTGYVGAVMIYGWRDYSNTTEFWGVETHEGRKKPSYTSLGEVRGL
jgi:Glycosyl hydrolase catalytic core